MSSPIVDCVREIPLIVERDYPMETGNTGFPFDDDREDSNATFRTQLDDIAARHPEFAHHLGSFPFRSSGRARNHIPEEFTQQRFTERPFPNRFERFGFPFDEEEPLREENTPYYQRYPQYYPQDQPENQGEPSFNSQEPEPAETEVNNENVEQEEPGRSRKLKNIQQSNTVDLGQRQEPVDDRNQRSMSAPPPNNRQRFVSSINIPVNQPKETSNVPPNMPQPSAPPQPQERVIPIHVEGRDEPIIPKKSSTSTSHPQPQQSQPYTDKFFTQRAPNFMNRDQNFRNDWFPKNFQNKQPQAGQRGKSPQPQAGQRGRSPQAQPKPEQQPTNIPEQVQHPAEATQPKPPAGKPDPIDQIKLIQKDVSALMAEVDKFTGKPKDKKYLYLDEMLTRNLIKLDNIDTQGQENIRLARKEAIKCIEKCINILESKANSNAAEEEKQSKVEESDEAKPMEAESTEQKEEKQEGSEETNTMEVDKIPEESTNAEKNSTDEKMEVDSEKVENTTEQQNNEKTEGSAEAPVEKMETSGEKKEKDEQTSESKQNETNTENSSETKKDSESTNKENEVRSDETDDKKINQKA